MPAVRADTESHSGGSFRPTAGYSRAGFTASARIETPKGNSTLFRRKRSAPNTAAKALFTGLGAAGRSSVRPDISQSVYGRTTRSAHAELVKAGGARAASAAPSASTAWFLRPELLRLDHPASTG